MNTRRIIAALRCIGICGSVAVVHVLNGEQFKRFPETISPDGAYVLAWGMREDAGDATQLTETPYEDEAFDEANREGDVANYLVDVAAHKVIATIPGFEYWRGPKYHKNRADLDVAWSLDGKSALAIFGGRWGSEAVAWIEPRTRKIVDVQKQLEKGFYSVLHKSEPSFDQVDVLFQNAVIPKPGLLVVHASGTIPKERDTSDYLLKFKITGEGEKIEFHLQSGRRLRENFASEDADPEAELNKVYNSVRTKLPQKQSDLLRDEQKKWLKLREEINDDNCKTRFTNHRIVELRARLEQD